MMAETHFYITLNIKTADGLETFGKFLMGNDSEAAYSIFQKLKGNKKVTDKSILTLELMEISHGLPFNIQLMSCTLEELGENCKIITKETFKRLNLNEM